MNLERRYTPAYHSFQLRNEESTMSKVVIDMSMSLDGFVAGPDDGREHPLGRQGRKRAIGEHNGRQAVG